MPRSLSRPLRPPSRIAQSRSTSRLERSRWRGGRFACCAHLSCRRSGFNRGFRFSLIFVSHAKSIDYRKKIQIPKAVTSGVLNSPRPPQPPAATFQSLYRKRANTLHSCPLLARASDTALRLPITDRGDESNSAVNRVQKPSSTDRSQVEEVNSLGGRGIAV